MPSATPAPAPLAALRAFAPKLADWRRPLPLALLACLAVALAAAVWPVGGLPPEINAGLDEIQPPPTVAAPDDDDLEAFAASDRWGRQSLNDIIAAETEPEADAEADAAADAALNPVLADIGFVGFSGVDGKYTGLLSLPEGGIARLAPGDALPDGRVIDAIADNSITLRHPDADPETIPLFPRAQASPPDTPGQ